MSRRDQRPTYTPPVPDDELSLEAILAEYGRGGRLCLLPRLFQSLYLTRNPRPRLRRNRSRNLSPSRNPQLSRSLHLNRRIRLFPTCRIASV